MKQRSRRDYLGPRGAQNDPVSAIEKVSIKSSVDTAASEGSTAVVHTSSSWLESHPKKQLTAPRVIELVKPHTLRHVCSHESGLRSLLAQGQPV